MGKMEAPALLRYMRIGAGTRRGGFWLLLFIGLFLFSTLPAVWASEAIEYGYRIFSYPEGTGGNSEVTAEKPESKLWWNDGYWWGSLWSTQGDAYHIHRLDLATQSWADTGTTLDDRSGSRADTLWDGQHLYVVSHLFDDKGGEAAPAGSRGELYRYSYDSATKSYNLDVGFPVEVTGGKSETLVLEKDSNGQLWVTYVQDDWVMVNRSLNGDDQQWGTPFALPFPEANVDSDDISSIITYNQHVGVMWSNQDSTNEMYFAVHPDDAPDDTWTQVRAYKISGDDHINLKSLEADSEGNVYAAIKTSRNAELIVVLVCERNVNRCKTESDWSSYPVYDGTHSPTRPILLIDTSNRELYVFTRNKDANGNSAIYYKSADLDNIQFAEGIGTPFIRSTTETGINDPTSTKQNLTSTTGMVVLASDSGPNYYFHNYKSLSGEAIQYTVTTNTVGAGSVSLDPPGGSYDEGTTVSATALAEPDWTFSSWSGDLTGTTNPASLSMNTDKVITATFTHTPQYTLTVNRVGSGNVTLDPPGGVYDEGTAVSLTAEADAGWTFSDWSGDLTGTSNPASITMDADKTVTATFVPEYSLTINTMGSGNVSLDPPGGTYAEGTEVTLTAAADPGWRFSGWSGDLTGSANPASLTMDADKTVTATFVPRYTLTVNVVGSGNVSLDPSGGEYDEGTVVSLAAEASSSWNFSGWSGDLSGSDNPTTITMDSDKTVTATFSLPQYTLTVNTVGSGNVSLDPPGGAYDEGTLVELTATADAGWSFGGWSGDLTGPNNPITIIMGGDKTVTATFNPPQHTLTVSVAGSGTVLLDPPGEEYDEGTAVSLTATADVGWRFSGWSGALVGTTNPANLAMDSDKDVLATFVQNEPGLQIDISASVMTATVGQVFTYTYALTNVGESTLSNVSVVDDRLGPVPLDSSTLSSGETIVASLPYTVSVNDLPGPLVNTATVAGTSPTAEVVTDSSIISISVTAGRYSYYVPISIAIHSPIALAENRSKDMPRATDRIVRHLVADHGSVGSRKSADIIVVFTAPYER